MQLVARIEEHMRLNNFGARLANGVSASAFKRQTTTVAVCLTSQKAQDLALRYQSSRCSQQSLSGCFSRREG